jgi:Tol biopolymer transport system component/tRNA A-37 threonylcarbamoyl transferase component Bud32
MEPDMTPERWREIEKIFQAALDYEPENREAFLDEACGQDAELRREVDQLLSADESGAAQMTARFRQALEDAARNLDEKSSMTGQSFGRYQIDSLLGEGGMGKVYLAVDTVLKRKVAIKFLPSLLTYDPDRVKRFEREAMAASALNHPNILTVHDFGVHEGTPYLVMELLEGEELRAQLEEGALPAGKALDYAQQIARGLAAAHEKGIVHRDLKPENLIVTRDGLVKILDFGLAKLRPEQTGQSGSEIATPKQITHPGTVMGTVGYMSPEQVRGQDVDHRSDIFSLGAILFEMLSGQRTFAGESAVDVMNAILKEEPPEIGSSGAIVPPGLEKIVRRCLEKRPEHRFHSAHDLGFALEAVSGNATGSAGFKPAISGSSSIKDAGRMPALQGRERIAWIIAVVGVLVALFSLPFAVKYLNLSPPAAPVAWRFTIAAPEKVTSIEAPEISPDGRHLVFGAFTEGRYSLWLRPMGSLTAQPLPGTEGVNGFPFWSQDSRSIGFIAGGELRKLDLAGGAAQTLCRLPSDVNSIFGGTWSRDGVILFSDVAGIYRVPATGGEPVLALRSDQPSLYRLPVFLFDGRHFLVRKTPTQGTAEIHLAALDSQETTRLLVADSQARYANGHLLFARAGALVAQSFDAGSLKLTGEPFVVADKVRVASQFGRAFFSVSDNGSLVYDPNALTNNQQLTWVDRAGKPLGTVGPPDEYETPRLSPDGKQLAVLRRDPRTRTWDIYVIDLARGAGSRLTFDPGDDISPVWSPDGSRIAWGTKRDGAFQIYQKLASGIGQEELLLKADAPIYPDSWSADGRFLLYYRLDPKTRQDLWVLPLAGDRQPALFLQTPFTDTNGRFSPDGRWIAYTSDDQGRYEVNVQPFPASGSKWQISTSGGQLPWWRSDGKELYYLSLDGKLMAVEVKPGGSFEATVPRALFDLAPARALGGTRSYAVTAAGDRFLFITAREQTASSQFTVVTNWAAEVKK